MQGEGDDGLWGAEPALMDAGESPNAENADGRSALMLAAAAGDLPAVRTLIAAGALLDAQDHYGMTALMNAVVMRRLEATRLLAGAGADTNAREKGGRTALMFAAATDHAEIVECLVVAGTDLDATCGPRSRTALMIAAEGAREKALRMLLAHCADPSIRDADGKTAASLARTKRMVRLLRKYDRTKERSSFLGSLLRGKLHRSDSDVKSLRRLGTGSCKSLELEPAVALDIGLSDVRSLCSAMQESQFPCDRIYERLADVSARLQSTAQVVRKSNDVNDEYVQVLSDFYALLSTFSSKHAITRLLSSTVVMKSCFDLHSQLDDLEEKLLSANHFEAKLSWQQQWEIDRETHQALLMDFITQSHATQDDLTDEEARVEALTLLSFEWERRKTKYSTQQLYLMHKYAQSVTRTFHTLVVSAPQWFIPAYDIEFTHDATGVSSQERLGFWSEKPVLVKPVAKHEEQKRFSKDVEDWMALQHPHILQLYGACHVGDHPFVVFEAASANTLAEYLRRQRLDTKPQLDLQNFQLIWRKLYQVALAVEYLHERKIAHGQLHRSSSITVDASGSVKLLMDFRNVHPEDPVLVTRSSSISSSGRRLMDAGDAFATDIYMLGRLVLNALTLSDWPRELDLKDGETLPKRPISMTNAHWTLIERMCATNASQRCDISSALQQIEQFAAQCGGTFLARAAAGFSPIRAFAVAMRAQKLDEGRRATLSAMHSKHWPTVGELLSPSDKSALVRAASSEDTDAVRALIEAGGSLDARDQYGDTALICAASTGRSENVQLLVDAGADLEARDTGGRTALMWAASADHAGIMEYLIKAGAAVNAIGGSRARTALMIAAERGCEDAVRVLLANGATALISDCDGKTAMEVARTRHIRRVIRKQSDAPRERSSTLENLLHRHFGSTKRSDSRKAKTSDKQVQPSVASCLTMISSAGIGEVQTLCSLMQESRFVCDRIYDRLAAAPSQRARVGFLDSYGLVLEDFQAFLTVYSRKHPITRLLSSNLIMQMSRNLHTRLDAIESGTDRSKDQSSWQQQWEIDGKTHQELLMEFMTQNNVNVPVAAEEDARVEALTLLSFECERRKSKYTTQQLYLMHKYLQAYARSAHSPVASVPKWFIPAYEIELLQNADKGDNSMRHGTWYELPVAIKAVTTSDKSQHHKRFKRDVEAQLGLEHPNILQLHGACHVGDEPFMIYEYASSETLAKYLNRKSLENQTSTEPLRDHHHYRTIWRKLYQVALALEYLHERKIAHGELHRSNSVVVDANGEVKLSMDIRNAHPVVTGTSSSGLSSDCRATRSGDAFTSDIYALGLLIFNCMMLSELPSEIEVDENETLPKRPISMTNAHWMLIERMCATNASQRCDVVFALQKIKQLADL